MTRAKRFILYIRLALKAYSWCKNPHEPINMNLLDLNKRLAAAVSTMTAIHTGLTHHISVRDAAIAALKATVEAHETGVAPLVGTVADTLTALEQLVADVSNVVPTAP